MPRAKGSKNRLKGAISPVAVAELYGADAEVNEKERGQTYGEAHARVLRGPIAQRLDRAWAAGHNDCKRWAEGMLRADRQEKKALKEANIELQQELRRMTKLVDLLLEKYAGPV